MKKVCFLFTAFLFFSVKLFAITDNLSLTIEPVAGLRNGILTEYVYSTNSVTGAQYHLSQLDWDIKNAFYTGLNADIRYSNFHLNVGGSFIIPSKNGNIFDYDWLQDDYYETGNTSVKTNYSQHDINLEAGANFNASLRYDFHPAKFIRISPVIEFTYEYYHMYGNDGYLQYGNDKYGNYYIPSNLQNTSHEFHGCYEEYTTGIKWDSSGSVLELTRYDYYTWIGFDIGFSFFNNRLKLNIEAAFSPYTYLDSRDSHLLTGYYFADLAKGYFSSYKGKISASFNFNQMFGINFSVSGLFTQELKGIEYTSKSKEGPYSLARGSIIGNGSKYFDIVLSATATF